MKDTFKGDNTALCNSIEALLSLDASGSLVPHGIGGHARSLLEASHARLASQPATPAPVPVVQGEAVPDGCVVVPAWKGYALLGTGRYLINHSADFDPELGAELFITLAADEDRAGDRQIGESRDTREPEKPVQPEDMVLRIGFLSERALFALEDQLRLVRETHFATPAPEQATTGSGQADRLKSAFDEGYGLGHRDGMEDCRPMGGSGYGLESCWEDSETRAAILSTASPAGEGEVKS